MVHGRVIPISYQPRHPPSKGWSDNPNSWWTTLDEAKPEEQKTQSVLLRDIFGALPFRQTTVEPAWLTSNVVGIARAAYEERVLPSGHLAPVRLAVLADALEEAGCADRAILDHLRGPGPHVRGCWPVDLLTGRK
jgi:hypothetical protein